MMAQPSISRLTIPEFPRSMAPTRSMRSTSSCRSERAIDMKRSRNPRYLKQYRDAAGDVVNQYRRQGKLVRLPNGRDFNDAFWKAYYEAEASVLRGEVRQVGETRTRPNSIDAALVAYYRSTAFLSLAEN